MDQGIAGVIAGVAGLVGAGIGGLATAYGARIGAQKTIEAAQTQVKHQSAAEHVHWVREQRRLVYSELAKLHASFTMTSIKCKIDLVGGQPLAEEAKESLIEQVTALGEVSALTVLWGPDDVVIKARRLPTTAAEKFSALVAWSAAAQTGSATGISRCSAEYGAADEADKEARHEFASTTRRALAAPS
ncbi:hypothetical protein AB0D78_16210 [Streptomyces avermitilis]|uniref:hypothetical protein n=1 Tax=Streptomyces avermitilis TaxID=33903 RepID=UPI0033E4076B